MCRFLTVLRNYDCLTAQYDEFCISIYIYIHIKSTWRNNWSQLSIYNVVDTWNGCLNNRKWTKILRTKFSSAMKHISHSVGMLTNKTWGSEDSQVIEKRPLRPENVTVWCVLWSESVIGSYFFKNNDGTTVSVNSERYVHIITDFFCLVVSTRRYHMPHIISRLSDINWPPRSCDLTPLRFFCGATRKTAFMQINLQLLST